VDGLRTLRRLHESQPPPRARASAGAIGLSGKTHLTSLITTRGRQFEDWSADYSLYARQRIYPSALFGEVRARSRRSTPRPNLWSSPWTTRSCANRKCIPNTAYRKDPLGPAFHLNLVWAQRMIQLSAAVPANNGDVRMIPVAFQDASTPRKPRKTAPPEQWEAYREHMKQTNLNRRALDAIRALQQDRTATGQTAPCTCWWMAVTPIARC